MKALKRTTYYTMNSWNLSKAPAYNLKVYNVIGNQLQDRVFELMECDNFYDDINWLIRVFGERNNWEWQAGFNGRSGGYLVLYRGGTKPGYKSVCTKCGQGNCKTVEESVNNCCGRCHANARITKDIPHIYTQPGMGIELKDVPGDILRAFRKLAVDIVRDTEYKAKHTKIEQQPTGQTVPVMVMED